MHSVAIPAPGKCASTPPPRGPPSASGDVCPPAGPCGEALPVKPGVQARGGTPVVYGNKPQSHRAHRGRTDGDDYLIGKRSILFKCWLMSELNTSARSASLLLMLAAS
jgi:hypothetical protein